MGNRAAGASHQERAAQPCLSLHRVQPGGQDHAGAGFRAGVALRDRPGRRAPCGECRTCQRVAQGRYPDVQFIAAEKNAIQIDQVRALQADAAVAPLEGRRKIFIIQEIERATLPAANALLKSLEEPPPQVILLLTATRRDQVLPTDPVSLPARRTAPAAAGAGANGAAGAVARGRGARGAAGPAERRPAGVGGHRGHGSRAVADARESISTTCWP